MPTHLSRLPRETAEYIERAYRAHTSRSADDRAACPGVMIPGWGGVFASPRAGWWLALAGGLALVGLAVFLALQIPDTPRHDQLLKAAGSGLALGLGYVLVRTGLTRARRPGRDTRLGNFLFADATRVWEVAGGYVATFEIGDDVNAVGYRHTSNGSYTHTTITARSARSGSRTWSVVDIRLAQRLLDLLQIVGQLRRSEDDTYRSVVQSGPGYVARAAMLILDHGVTPADGYPPIVHPPATVPDEAEAVLGVGGVLARWATGTALAAAVCVGFWKVGGYLRDERLHAAAGSEAGESFRAVDHYLAEFPDGRHAGAVRDLRDDRMFGLIPTPLRGEPAERPRIERYLSTFAHGRHTAGARDLRDEWFFASARRDPDQADHLDRLDKYLEEYPEGKHTAEVRDLRDDKLFAVAVKDSESSRSPGGLRKYLAEKGNTRHRQEATRLIGGYYEKAAADLRARAEKLKAEAERQPGGAPIDPQLIRSLVALVEALKTADDPVLTVGFTPAIEAQPRAPAAKKSEEESYKFHVNEGKFKDELKRLERTNPNNTALIAHAGTFEDESVRAREDMIFTRLSDAIERGIKADILTLRRAKPGEPANIEVRYRVFPAGYVVPFNEVNDDNSHKRTIGLVREYYIDWVMTFRPPGGGPATEYRTETRPGPNLLYRMEPGDPDWAIYAVSLYSAFYGLSDKMIRALGQDPGPMPDAFTWKGTSSFRAADRPRLPLEIPKFDPKLLDFPKFDPKKFEVPLPDRKFP